MKKNPWFRLYTEAVDDEKLRLLAFEDRWHFVAILCCKGKGLLDDPSDSQDLMRRKIAVKLGLDSRSLDEVARRLAEVGLIDQDTLQPVAWDARQFDSDNSSRPSTDVWKIIRKRIFERDNYTCGYCGVRGVRLECDHVIPVSRGGSNAYENLSAACFACNRSKGNKLVEEWMP